MPAVVRPFTEDDWSAAAALAAAAVPFDPRGNARWLRNRRHCDAARLARRHYLVEEPAAPEAVAYGAVEQTGSGSRYRLYMVVHPAWTGSGVDDTLFERLIADLRELGASVVWAMEYHD